MPLFSKLVRHLQYPKPPTTTATTGKGASKSPRVEVVTLSGQAQILLTSLRDIRGDLCLILYHIRLLTPDTREKQNLFEALCEDPRPETENEEWAATQKAITILRKELSRAQKRFSEKRALVEVVVKEEWELRNTIMAGVGVGEGESELADTGFLNEVVEMEDKVQECKDTCQALDSEARVIRVRFAELARYQGAVEGKVETMGGVERGGLV